MKIVWSQHALRDLMEVEAFVADDKPEAARRLAQKIYLSVSQLSEFPEAGRPGRRPGTREVIVAGTPYWVPYRIRKRGIEVIAVLHGRRKWL